MTKYKLSAFLFFVWLTAFAKLYCENSEPNHSYSPSATLHLPMRDGTLLPTDIYLPSDLSQKYPVILLRNPSGRKALPWVKYSELANAGYIVAIQDTRSSIDSAGKTMPYYSDGWGHLQDGYDTVEALAKFEHSNGKIGTAGFSATGITQLLLAPTAPPSLCAQYIGVAASNLYHHAIYPGGALQKNQVEGWLKLYAKDPSMNVILAREPFYNNFWKNFNCNDLSHNVNIPGLLYTGWYDTFLQGTIDAFIARQENGGEGAKGRQKLIIGPWTHFWPQSTKLGDFEAPENGKTAPWNISPLAWFDYHLKGIPTGIEEAPIVTYYVMGPYDGTPSKGNVWKTARSWPIPHKQKSYYFAENRQLKTAPSKMLAAHTYIIDPDRPVPTIGGCNLFLEAGPKDQRPVEAHKDVLVFTTEPLTEDLEVTGKIHAKIYYKAIEGDADIVVRLCDVYPDGRSILIADGIYRINSRQPGAQIDIKDRSPRQAEVDLWSTSTVFAKGHRIRVSVCGSNYPRFEKISLPQQSKVGAGCLPTLTFFSGEACPSQIVLPVIE